DVGLDVLGRQQHCLVPEAAQHPGPMVRGAARLQPDSRRLLFFKKLLHFAALKLSTQNRLLLLVDTVHLKDVLGPIQANSHNRHRTAPPAALLTSPQSGTADAVGGRPPQHGWLRSRPAPGWSRRTTGSCSRRFGETANRQSWVRA